MLHSLPHHTNIRVDAMKNEWDDTEDKKKERERKERIQHPHMIKSRSHWDNEQAYWDLLKESELGADELGEEL